LIKSRRIRLEGLIAHMRERRGMYRVLVEKPEGKRVKFPCGIIVVEV